MEDIKTQINDGIKLHTIRTSKFKTNLISIFFTTELNKENVTKNALISLLLRRGKIKHSRRNLQKIRKYVWSFF